MEDCPSENLLSEFVAGKLSPAETSELNAHVGRCSACRFVLAHLMKSRPAAAAAPLEGFVPPERVAEYRVLRPLGRGAMGQVYLAHDTVLDRQVALKFVSAPADPGRRQRFLIEARAIARLAHANIVTLHRVGEEEGRPYLVCELVRGRSLAEVSRPLAGPRVLAIATGLARGLAAAHRHGVLHRDLKPANVMLSDDDGVKLLDFGLAKLLDAAPPGAAPGSAPDIALDATAPSFSPALTETGALVGTPLYIPPERWRQGEVTARSDIYSAGALLYELCSGQPPHTAPTLEALRRVVQEEDARPLLEQVPTVDPRLAAVIDRCLRREPAARFASGEELSRALEEITAPRARSRRWLLAAPLLGSMALAAGLGYGLRDRREKAVASEPGRPRRAVAVLGFRNISGRSDAAWLSTALSEMLSTELAAGDRLRILPGENVAQMKRDLSLPEAESYGPDTLHRIRTHLGTDLVALGSYIALGKDVQGQVRLDLRLQDARTGETLAAVADAGREGDLFDLVSRTGERLRERLGVGRVPAAEIGSVRASLPSDPEAARLYAEGLAKLRQWDFPAARELLEQAVVLEPSSPFIHRALAEVWIKLGYDEKAKRAAKQAFESAAGLRREDRLQMEAAYHGTAGEIDKAVTLYQTLFEFYPDNLEYGLNLAGSQVWEDPRDTLRTLDLLRKLSPPARDDVRIVLQEALAATGVPDHPRALQAARRAAQEGEARGMRLLVGRAKRQEALVLTETGEIDKAMQVTEEAQRILAAVGDRLGLAAAAYSIAAQRFHRGDLAKAVAAHEQVMTIARDIGSRTWLPRALFYSSGPLLDAGRLALAKQRADEGLLLSRQRGLLSGDLGLALIFSGQVHCAEGRLAAARRSYLDATAVLARDLRIKARGLQRLGELSTMEGDLSQARKLAEEALALQDQFGQKPYSAQVRRSLAMVALEEGRLAEAGALAREATLELARQKAPDEEARAGAVLATALLAQKKRPQAQAEIARARERAAHSESLRLRQAVTVTWARVLAASGRPEDATEARRSLLAALAEAERAGYVPEQLEDRLALGEIEIGSGRAAAGLARLHVLEKDARSLGFGLIARKAAAVR